MPKIWVKEYLLEDLKDLNPNIIFSGYETFQTKSNYKNKNVPEDDIYQLSEKVKDSMHKVEIGKGRPVILVCFSMGGIIAKHIMNSDK
mmetsp:Transcript_9119/g.10284  ORF Transcript_9119/g.10284 Transcript_9119/m.10284 type:complete len:88 (+) Transcript_9119:415-678(+)